MSRPAPLIRTARVVTLLTACGLTVSAMAQQAQEGKAPEPTPKAEGYSPHLGRCLKVEAMPPWLTSGSA